MLRFFHALQVLFLLGTFTVVNARLQNTHHQQLEYSDPEDELYLSSEAPFDVSEVHISHAMNPSHPESICILLYRLPDKDTHINFRDDVVDYCMGPDGDAFLYSMSDRPGEISSASIHDPGPISTVMMRRRLVGKWRRVPSASDHTRNREELVDVRLDDHGRAWFQPYYQFRHLSAFSIGRDLSVTDCWANPENEDSFWYLVPSEEYPVHQRLKHVMRLRRSHKTFYEMKGEPGEMTEIQVSDPETHSLGIWRRMPQKTVLTIYRHDMLVIWKDRTSYHHKVFHNKVRMIGWDPTHPL